MKRIISSIIIVLILATSVLSLTAFARETPQIKLNTEYDIQKKTVTVFYRVLNFAGTESADFRLKYDRNVLEFTDYTTTDIENTVVDVIANDESDKIAIQFIDLYYVKESDCEEDGSATVATLTFKIKDTSALETVFIATADTYAMDPNSMEVSIDRDTLKIFPDEIFPDEIITEEATTDNINSNETLKNNSNMTKIIIAAVVTAVVFVAGLVAVVVKYRKK